MKIALVSSFLEDDVYEKKLTDTFMNDVICNEDHFYHRIAKSLSALKIDVTVIYMSNQKIQKNFTHKFGHKIIRFPVTRIPFFPEPIVYSSKLPKFIKKNFDVCHFVSGYYVMYKVPDMFDYIISKIYRDIPIVARWAGGNFEWLLPVRKNIKKKALQRCDKIICSGLEENNILRNEFQIPSNKIKYLINPIDLEMFKKQNKEECVSKLKLDINKKYFLYVGRLTKNKGIEELLSIFRKIIQTKKEMILLFIGDGPMMIDILSFIKENSLENNIQVLGRLTHEKISQYHNAATALFHIGTSGGLPNSIIESVASQLPVIASDNNANRDLINEKFRTGIIIKSNKYSEIDNAITKIIENEKEFCNKVPHLLYDYSLQSFGEKMIKIYEEIILNKKSKS